MRLGNAMATAALVASTAGAADYDLPRSDQGIAVTGRVECLDEQGCAVWELCRTPAEWATGAIPEGPMPAIETGEVYRTERVEDETLQCKITVHGKARVWAYREHMDAAGKLLNRETVKAKRTDVDRAVVLEPVGD